MAATSLVTGGGGFIGRHLVDALLARGDSVRVLDIDPPHAPARVEYVAGSILDADAVRRATRGVDTVFHLAAIPHLWTRHAGDYDRVNRLGTERLLAAAAERGVERFIHCSTEAILFSGRNVPPREQSVPGLADMPGPYTRSKFLAEQAALEAAKRGLPVTIVNPTLPIGPGDDNCTPPCAMLSLLVRRPPPLILDCTLNLVDVRDVARGMLLAQQRGQVGERYILGGENFSLAALVEALDRMCGRERLRPGLPGFVALATGIAAEFVATHITGRRPAATVEGVRLALRSAPIDSAKARRELGYQPRSVSPALAEVVQQFAAPRPVLVPR
jgi:dihydroflavonol-4-reductase